MAATDTSAQVLRTKSDDELLEELGRAKESLFNLRFQSATGQLESHGRLRAVRRDIARIYTVMRERELGITTVEDEEKAWARRPARRSGAFARCARASW